MRIPAATDKQVEDNWNENWKQILIKEDGSIDLDQLKRELMDFSDLMKNAREVYHIVSGYKLSYASYPASTVIDLFEEHMEEMYDQWEEDYKDDNNCNCGVDNEKET